MRGCAHTLEVTALDPAVWHAVEVAADRARVDRVARALEAELLLGCYRYDGGVRAVFLEGVARYDEFAVVDRISGLLQYCPGRPP